MIYKILVTDINGTMQFASDRVKTAEGCIYNKDFETKDFNKAKDKFMDLLDLYKINQLKIVGDLEEEVSIDIKLS